MYYPILFDEPNPPLQEFSRSPSPPPGLASKSLRNDQIEHRELLLDALVGRVVTGKSTVEPEGECQIKQEEILLELQVDGKETVTTRWSQN